MLDFSPKYEVLVLVLLIAEMYGRLNLFLAQAIPDIDSALHIHGASNSTKQPFTLEWSDKTLSGVNSDAESTNNMLSSSTENDTLGVYLRDLKSQIAIVSHSCVKLALLCSSIRDRPLSESEILESLFSEMNDQLNVLHNIFG